MTDADLIKHLWTHKTQDHPSWSDEDLMVALDFADPGHRDRPLDRNVVARLNTRALDKGYIAMAKDSVFRLTPPLCIAAGEVDELAQLVGETVRELQDEVTRSTRNRVPVA